MSASGPFSTSEPSQASASPKTLHTRHQQVARGTSPWTVRQRIGMLLWEFCWALFCRWTPKPLNAWRLFWLRCFGCRIEGVPFVHQRARIQLPWNLTLRDGANLGDRANAYSLGPIAIGRAATVAQEAYLCSGTHDLEDACMPLLTAPIVIEENAFIGARSFVMPGVRIEAGAVLGAMSIATRDIPSWSVFAGNPARKIGTRRPFPLRVNIVQGAFFPVPPLRGTSVEKVWDSLGKEFARAGCEVTHISRLYGDLPAAEMRHGVRHLRIPGFDSCASTVLLKLRDLRYSLRARHVLPPADITVTNTFWLPWLLRSGLHGAIYVHVARFPKGQMNMYRHVARLQPVSQVVGDAISEQSPDVARLVKPLPNPIPENWLADEQTLANPRSQAILYVGRIHPEKGLDLLIDAFALLPAGIRNEWRLMVVGPHAEEEGAGGTGYLESLKRRAQLGSVQVDWVGPLYDPELLKSRYDDAEIFVYPSQAAKGEALPLAPVEAMARGCAPIVSSLRCFVDYLRDGENGLTFPAEATPSAPHLAAALQRLINDPELRLRLRYAALRTAANYTVKNVARRYMDDFATLLGRT